MFATTQPRLDHTYSLGERLLRLCVFQAGIYSREYPGRFERIIHYLFLAASAQSCSPDTFDSQRAQRSLDTFQTLGGEIEFVQSKDQKAEIQMVTFQASAFERKLHELGADWKKIQTNDSEILGIIPPHSQTPEWKQFEEAMLSRFRWEKKIIDHQPVIITCQDASAISSDLNKKLFVHINSASSVLCMHGERIGFFLGCKQDIVVFDPRGTWKSSGIPSEQGYYMDAETVLEHVLKKDNYRLNDVWITSACGGSCVGAHLKKIYHDQGINIMTESGYVNLDEDFFSQQSFLAKWFAFRFYSGVKTRDIQPEGPRETGFRIENLWEQLPKSTSGKIVVVFPENDQYLPTPQTPNKMIQLACQVNEHVDRISFVSKRENQHRDRFYRYPEIATSVLKAIFQPASS